MRDSAKTPGDRVPTPAFVRCASLDSATGELLLMEIPFASPVIPSELTPAEADVVRLLLLDMLPSDIARRRQTSTTTVRNQIRSVHKKLGVSSKPEVALRCFTARNPSSSHSDATVSDWAEMTR